MGQKKFLNLLILPSLFGIVLFYLLPFLFSLYYAMIDRMGTRRFIGFGNFSSTVHNPIFQAAVRNTVMYLLLSVPLLLLVALVLALCLQRINSMGKGLFLTVLLLPMMLPAGTTAFFWKRIFGLGGLVNKLLYLGGYPIINWQNDPLSVIIPVIIFLWKNTGFITALLLAGLNRIPQEYYEVAA